MAQRVLLTGANGFIAQHILSQLLEAGHSVRAVVRSQAKADQLRGSFAKDVSLQKLDFALVPDITAPSAFDNALASKPPFDTVLHTASPFNYRQVTNNLEFLEPAQKGTVEILQGITRVAPTVKRVILTSSIASVMDFSAPKETNPAKIYTAEDWNPTTWEAALSAPVINTAYVASKKFAEKAAWDFIAQQNPGFDLVVINPTMVYGPLYDPAIFGSPQELNQSNFGLWNNFLRPGLSSSSPVPANTLHLYADVRDVARAHVLSVTTPEASGKRFIISADRISNQRIANIFRHALKDLKSRIPKGEPEKEALPEGSYGADSSPAKNILGLTFHSAEETFAQIAKQLLIIEERSSNN
ncbi:hypothetical protein G7Z17_g3430 [Cylindrodendrum hubeiense]|uniref:NAD-dependent epimerase/dehydratase domain-containing protein n=1 Tax=Cylindrodendrum hubeiense TaxID=595255 RepID=A0A9P5LDJ5_9HYPO|nr:hypothetical protein G7Z17_g3430 [Cylindrodendrum hubeiense]